MQSIRRAAVRAARSSAIVAVPRQQIASFAMQVSKANARPAMMLPLARFFSQTSRVAQNENSGEGEEADGEVTETPATPASSAEVVPGTTVFVSNMTFDATDIHVQEAFSKYGEITNLKIARDGRGLSRGFAFVTFQDQEAADRAVEEANNSFWHGRRIYVNYRKSEGSSTGNRNANPLEPTDSLYIGNIPYETSDADLNKIFRELDNVTDVRVAVDRNTGWPRGFAHADFADVESAMKAHEKLRNITVGDRTLRVDFAQNRKPKI
ncbi:RNA-binding domain-containing protein [Annulohypoxylon maeteangense]|uniref:RNA-binding domain-containing protein n=1 Tax=Annulohypoxylon maeteangense TaxID=1927788 RepID=UPI00200729C5|nr:RNA-binding domain-containing protein [Annulohypoxylon maeteangense]KAI0890501.1 RNA-binding domain-containing protein [Annulohypoxylon maeteangense]